MDFKELFLLAKSGDKQAIVKILEMYRPLMIKKAIIEGHYDEDLYQEFCITLLKCIKQFNF